MCYAGGVTIDKAVNELLLMDNKTNEKMLAQIGKKLPAQFPPYLIEHIKTRCLSTLQREQKIAYEKESEKMKQKRFVLN